MKKIIVALVCVCFLGVSILAQTSGRTRPRIVTTPTPIIPQDDSSNKDSGKRPPILKGGTGSTNQTPTTTQSPVVEDDEVIRVETNLVTLPVSVLDRDGRFISGLQKQDFRVFENGVEQKVESFASVEQPFTVILMLDVSPSTQYQINQIQDAAIAFVNQLRRDDKIMVVSFDEKFRVLSPVTNDRNALRDAIMRAQFGDGTSLYEAVDRVINRELRQIQGRKAVVLFTDGVDTTSKRASYQGTIRAIEEADALFYPIRYDTSSNGFGGGTSYPNPRNRRNSGGGIGDIIGIILGGGNVQVGGGGRGSAGSSREEYETGRRYLEELARNSGGREYEAKNNLDAAFSGIAEELRRQYSIGYYPETVGQKGTRKQIRVRVMRPNVVVRAKDSYVVGDNERNVAGK